MQNLLFKPIIFISIFSSIFIVGQLIVIGGLTWRNQQRVEILIRDIRNDHRIEEAIFTLFQGQYSQSDGQTEQDQILNQHPLPHINNQQRSYEIQVLQNAFSQALQGDSASLVEAMEATRQLFNRHAKEEEKILKNIEDDSQLEFQLAISLPLFAFLLIFISVRYLFKRNVLLPLNALNKLLFLLAQGNRQPIQQQTADPVIKELFNNYNQLVIRLTELEEEHLHHTQELEQKVREKTQMLMEQNQKISRTERLSVVAELAASTSHELRNPLAGIQLALENILMEPLDTELKERLQLINIEIKRITRLLNDQLGLTRTETKASKPVNISQVCNEVERFLIYQIPQHVQLKLNIEPEIYADLPETHLRLALLNILINSIQVIGKHSGIIVLNLRRIDSQVEITITDSGPGFADEIVQQGIRPFVSMKKNGSGLGLAMVQRFVKSQQGQVTIENTPDMHACVTIKLPINKK